MKCIKITTLILAMICCLMTTGCQQNSNIENNSEKTDVDEMADDDYKVIDSGRCNENVKWEIRSDGVLYISGAGTVPTYESREIDGTIAPWRASAVSSQITDVIVSDGITGFGENAFYGYNLSSIRFGHDVIAYDYELGGCIAAKVAYIPSSMQDIDLFLYDSYQKGFTMTIYYEGTSEEWEKAMYSAYNFGYDGRFDNYDIHYNYEY